MVKSSFVLFLLLIWHITLAQTAEDERIAIQFFQLREYDKAEILLKKQFDLHPLKFYDYLYKTYFQLKKYDDAIEITKSILKGPQSKNIDFRHNLASAYYRKNDTTAAKNEWLNINDLSSENEYSALSMIAKYKEIRLWNLSEDLILKAKKKSKSAEIYTPYLIDIYVRQEKLTEAIDLCIQQLEKADQNYNYVFSTYSFLNESPTALRLMERKVYSKLTSEPNSDKWNELAMHLSVTAKDYEQAYLLYKSFDKRKNGNGSYIFQIAEISAGEQAYDVALEAYNYLIQQNFPTYSKMAFERKLRVGYQRILKNRWRDSTTVNSLHQDFIQFFSSYQFNASTAEIQLLFAEFTVKYLKRMDLAESILKKLLETPLLAKHHISRAKLDLADIKLAMNEIWEASLLYGQVDKEEKDSPLGEEARYKNSKVFYFNGDYELAEDLLSILKSSTSELIANDALHLATFIQDNLGDEGKEMAMKDVSSAELYFYQNKPKEAFKLLTSLKKVFPNSNLIDDVILIEANYAKASENYSEASRLYLELVDKHSSSILADRALYEWSIIEEEIHKNNEPAKEGYLKLLTKYKDSVFTTDARKRLRKLRGEKLDDEI